MPITPMEVYLQQVSGTFDAIRARAAGKSYIPPQFGGFRGQRVVGNDCTVLELISFDISATDSAPIDIVKSNNSENKYVAPQDPTPWIQENMAQDVAAGSDTLDSLLNNVIPTRGYF